MIFIHNFYAFIKRSLRSINLLVFVLFIPIFFASCNPVSSEEEAVPEYVWKSYNLNKIYNNEIGYHILSGDSPQNILITTTTNFYSNILYDLKTDSISFTSFLSKVQFYGGSKIISLNSVIYFGSDYNLYIMNNNALTMYRIMNRPQFLISNITNFFTDIDGGLYAIGTYHTNDLSNYDKGCIFRIVDNNYEIIASTNDDFTEFINIGEGSKSNKDKYYISSYDTYDHISYSCFYEYDGLSLNKIYQNDRLNDIFINMLQINNSIYFAFNKKLYSYSSNNFTPVINFSTLPDYLNQIYGSSLNNLFLSTREALYQYTGSSLNKIYDYAPHGQIEGALIFENDVFFLARVGYGTPSHHFELIHGYLK